MTPIGFWVKAGPPHFPLWYHNLLPYKWVLKSHAQASRSESTGSKPISVRRNKAENSFPLLRDEGEERMSRAGVHMCLSRQLWCLTEVRRNPLRDARHSPGWAAPAPASAWKLAREIHVFMQKRQENKPFILKPAWVITQDNVTNSSEIRINKNF